MGATGRPVFGFVGLGNIGLPMASNVLAAGHDLVVYDVRAEPMQQMQVLGASVAASPYELAQRCDIISIVVLNDAQVDAVMFEPDGKGLVDGARPGSIVVVHSTVSPKNCRRIADLAAARGVNVVDAPVSGGDFGARAGTLGVFAGGDGAAVARCRPLFDAIGSRTHHMGDVGMGQLTKISNNYMSIIFRGVTKEVLHLATVAGVDHGRMLEAIQSGSADSWIVRNWLLIEEQFAQYPTGPEGAAAVDHKDLQLALSAAHDLGVRLPLADVVDQGHH